MDTETKEVPTSGYNSKILSVLRVLFAIVFLMVVVSFLWIHQKVSYNERAIDPSGISVFKVRDCLPDLDVEDKSALGEKLGPLRLAQEEWYCAGQWDAGYFSRAAKILEDNRLLMSQLQGVQPRDSAAYGDLPVAAANFIKVVEVASVLLMDRQDVLEMKSQGVPLPEPDVIAKVAAAIDVNRPVTVPSPLPQAYQLRSKSPAIRLITNIGLNYSLRELSDAIHNEAHPDPELEKTSAMLRMLAGGDSTTIDPLRSKNPLMSLIGLDELMYLHASKEKPDYLFRSHNSPSSPRPDLDMIVLSNPEVFASVPFLGDRDGYYDYKNSRIFAKVNSLSPLPSGKISKKISDAKILAALPPSLEHEFFHYLFFRSAISFSGFIAEGEATAYGEYEHQMMATGVQSEDEMSELFMKTMSSDAANSQDTERLNKLVEERTRISSPTPVQCECALSVYRANVATKTAIPLARLLSLSTPLFQSGPSNVVRDRYAQAWSVYHVDLVLQKGWGTQLESIAAMLNFGQPLSDRDGIVLSRISYETLEWVNTFIKGHKKECENIARSESSHGKQ